MHAYGLAYGLLRPHAASINCLQRSLSWHSSDHARSRSISIRDCSKWSFHCLLGWPGILWPPTTDPSKAILTGSILSDLIWAFNTRCHRSTHVVQKLPIMYSSPFIICNVCQLVQTSSAGWSLDYVNLVRGHISLKYVAIGLMIC